MKVLNKFVDLNREINKKERIAHDATFAEMKSRALRAYVTLNTLSNSTKLATVEALSELEREIEAYESARAVYTENMNEVFYILQEMHATLAIAQQEILNNQKRLSYESNKS